MSEKISSSEETKLTAALARVQKAGRQAAVLTTVKKNAVLRDAARAIKNAKTILLSANGKDLKAARSQGLAPAMIDRLTLTPQRIDQIAQGVKAVAALEDPVGKVLSKIRRPNGLEITRVRVPIGVILIIYEARPNVTAECAALCLKSGNAVILRGGRESFYTNQVMAAVFHKALKRHSISEDCVHMIDTTNRNVVDFLLTREKEIHLVIPRGGQSLIKKVVENSRIPVIKHYQGICHIYVDESADIRKAAAIAYNAKMQRPGVCNAMETLLVNKKTASRFLPELGKLLKGHCEVRGDRETLRYMPWANQAVPDDYGHEFLDKILAVKVVKDVQEAVDHIERFGSGHTESILTGSQKRADFFVQNVDSSSVMVNASTRFADGFEYGLGAEIGISTDKIHARGPMGLEGLTSYKYVVRGNGQIRK